MIRVTQMGIYCSEVSKFVIFLESVSYYKFMAVCCDCICIDILSAWVQDDDNHTTWNTMARSTNSTQGVKKKNFLCAESLSSSQSHVPLFFFTSSWLESEVCSIFVCFWCVCGWSRKYSYYIVFKSCSMNESYIVWCFMMLIQIIIMLISYFE